MTFEREKKINRLLLQAIKFKDPYLKPPIEMIEFAFKEAKISEVGTYLASQFIYSGKARIEGVTVSTIGTACNLKPRSIYSAFKWLIYRDWMGKDPVNGWYFFRGINHVHQLEGWKYSKSALMFEKDLQEVKAFFIGAIISNFIRNAGAGTEQTSRRSKQSCYPVSLSIVQKLFNVSEKTAFNYRKLAQKHGFIKMIPNLRQVTGITPKDLIHLKKNDVDRVELPVFGSSEILSVSPKQLRTDKGFIYAQLPNLITPKVLMSKRNVSRSKLHPPTGYC